ncbi:MAG: hypothetical protein CM1200mP13_08810 [Candidatus Pelagibacterales bacterium]|nr:MAG: hypothetical protein CM1200mP13_08810 [Pelagibacterales bacterium]
MILTPVIKRDFEETDIYQKQLEEKVGLAQQENEQKFKQKRNREILRQIILKNIGKQVKKKFYLQNLIVGMGGLGCPVAEFLTRSGIGTLGIADHDTVSLSNIHRQSLYNEKDINNQSKDCKKKIKKNLIQRQNKYF